MPDVRIHFKGYRTTVLHLDYRFTDEEFRNLCESMRDINKVATNVVFDCINLG